MVGGMVREILAGQGLGEPEPGKIFYVYGDLDGRPLPSPQPVMLLARATFADHVRYWTEEMRLKPHEIHTDPCGEYWHLSTD